MPYPHPSAHSARGNACRIALWIACAGLWLSATAAAPQAKTGSPAKTTKKSARVTPSSSPLDTVGSRLSPGDTLLASVGARYITLGRFRNEWNRLDLSQRPNVPDPEIAYHLFLADLVDRELLAQEAQRVGETLTRAQEADVESLWHVQARNQLFIEDVQNRVTVDTTQVERYRTQLTRVLFVSAYVFPTREKAQAWYTRIVSGMPISRLVEAAKAGGPDAPQFVDLGHKIREDFDEESAATLFALPPGRLSPPVNLANGWGLLQVTSYRTRPNSLAMGSRETVLREMRRIKANSYKEVYRDSLAKSIRLAYREAAMDTMVNRFLLLRQRISASGSGAIDYHMFQPMPEFQPGDSALVLATSELGPVTGHDLYVFLLGLGEVMRPEIRSRDELAPWVDRVAFNQLLLRRAVEQGYDRSPRVLQEVALRREKYQVAGLYADSVSSRVRLSEADLHAYYDADSSRWMSHETVSMWVCVASSRAAADSILHIARAGGNLKELAFNNTALEAYSENGGMVQAFVREQCPTPAATDSIFATRVGSFGGPIASFEGWVIFKVLTHEPDRMRPFSEVHDDVAMELRNKREDEVMGVFLERLRKRYTVEIHEEWLAKVSPTPSKS